jgi:hypothetical protein
MPTAFAVFSMARRASDNLNAANIEFLPSFADDVAVGPGTESAILVLWSRER